MRPVLAHSRVRPRSRNPLQRKTFHKVGPVGFEPTTYGLKGLSRVSEGVGRGRFRGVVALSGAVGVGWCRAAANGDGCRMAAWRLAGGGAMPADFGPMVEDWRPARSLSSDTTPGRSGTAPNQHAAPTCTRRLASRPRETRRLPSDWAGCERVRPPQRQQVRRRLWPGPLPVASAVWPIGFTTWIVDPNEIHSKHAVE